MGFYIVPTAEASVVTLVKSINKVIINPMILFLFAVAMVYFLYGLAQYLLSPENEEVRKKSKSVMIWGVVGLFIMTAVFGIMNIITNTFGINNIKINENGNYTINGTTPSLAIPSASNPNNDKNLFPQDLSSNISTPTSGGLTTTPQPKIDSYIKNPFTQQYIEDPNCWHRDMYTKALTEYDALQSIKTLARSQFISDNNLVEKDTNPSLPTVYGVLSSYNSADKNYYVWWDVRAPINGANPNVCNLLKVDSINSRSTKPDPLQGTYVSDTSYYRIVDSGVANTYIGARSIAINNALLQIAVLKGINNTSSIVYNIVEEKYYPQDPVTKNYDYWVAIQSPK